MDVTYIQLYLAQLHSLNNNQIAVADTDKDGDVKIMDATLIQLFIAQLITEF